MLTMLIKNYCVNGVINVKPIYLNKHVFTRLFKIIMKNYNLLLQRKCSLKLRIKKV